MQAAHPHVPRRGRGADCGCLRRQGSAAGAGRALAQPCGIRRAQPGLGALAARIVPRPLLYPPRSARLRPVRLEAALVRLRELGRRSGSGGGYARPEAVRPVRHVAGRRRRHRLCGAPSGTGLPSGAARRLWAGPAAARRHRGAARGGRDPLEADPLRLGPRQSRLPPALHLAVHPRRHQGAAAMVQRSGTDLRDARQCRRDHRDLLPHRRRGAGRDAARADARVPCPA